MSKYGFEVVNGSEHIWAIAKYTGEKNAVANNCFVENMRAIFEIEDDY